MTLLRAGMASMDTARHASGGKPPAAATPEKCAMEMTPASFRSWRRSVEYWLRLAKWPDLEAVLHIRLLCVPSLQCTLDARYDTGQWEALTPKGALDAIGKLVQQSSNQAVKWCDFFGTRQGSGESVSVYMTRCAQEAADCGFQCPKCDGDLTEYMMLRKVMVGLSDQCLRQEVYRKCSTFNNIDSLREFCASFEAARRDATFGGKSERECAVAGADVTGDDVTEEPVVAGYRQHGPAQHQPDSAPHAGNSLSKPCNYCGEKHGKASCPARNQICKSCGKKGHVKKVCWSARKQDIVASSVTVGGMAVLPEPILQVSVTPQLGGAETAVMAVADTGAQVCVAGPNLMSSLGLRPALLQRRAGIRDLAKIPLSSLGAATCRISLPGHTTVQDVHFVKNVERLYLSCTTCKDLGLVHQDFPKPPTLIAGAEVMDSGANDVPERPTAMPIQPLEGNVPQLEQWLLRHFSSSTFNTECYPLRVMQGSPHHIHLQEGAHPYACHTPATVPKHWAAEVRKQLDEDVKLGVIRPVPAGVPTEWCARMVVVAKKSGKPRRTVDFQKLNSCCLRETHHTPTPFDMVSDVPPHSFKTVADAHWGFHQVELDEESRHLTTFITPWGRYQYCRTPMGHCSATDAYTKRFDDAISDFPRKHKCVDDTLLYDASIEQAFWHTYDFLERCARRGITLKPEKFVFCRREVEFVGFHLGWEAYKPTEDRL